MMSKRAVAAALWFAAIWFGYEIVWSVTGIPRGIGPVIAFAVAAFVTVDPTRAFWPRTAHAGARSLSTNAEASGTPI